MTVFLMRRKLGQRHIKKEDHVKTEREDNYQQCNKRNDQKKPNLPAHYSQMCSLQNCKQMHSVVPATQAVVLGHCSPSRLTQ